MSMKKCIIIVFNVCGFYYCLARRYQMIPSLSNYTCPMHLFDYQQVVSTDIACTMLCSRKSNCTAVVYQATNKTCYGLRNWNYCPEKCNISFQGSKFYTDAEASSVHNGSVYIVIKERQRFNIAQTLCRSRFGKDTHLTYVNTKAEMAHLRGWLVKETLPYSFMWFGGLRYADGVWRWTDGVLVEPWVWNQGQQNNSYDCSTYSPGLPGLYTRYCRYQRIPICEIDGM